MRDESGTGAQGSAFSVNLRSSEIDLLHHPATSRHGSRCRLACIDDGSHVSPPFQLMEGPSASPFAARRLSPPVAAYFRPAVTKCGFTLAGLPRSDTEGRRIYMRWASGEPMLSECKPQTEMPTAC